MASLKFYVIFSICYFAVLAILVMLQDPNLNPMSFYVLRSKESLLGYPGSSYVYTQQEENLASKETPGRVFVCMTVKPSRLERVASIFAGVPNFCTKVLVVPEKYRKRYSYPKSILETLSKDMKILRTKEDFGPISKIWALTEPVTAHTLGLNRAKDSLDIVVTIDDDFYVHKDLVVSLINAVVDSSWSHVIATKVDKDSLQIQRSVGSSGVAYPARAWSAALRGDIQSLMTTNEPCKWDDDTALSTVLTQYGFSVKQLEWTSSEPPVKPTSDSESNDSLHKTLLQNQDSCKKAIKQVPLL